MALLGMGANVQNNGYFPGYSSTNDLIFDSEGSMWTSSNVNTELKNDCHHIGSLPVLSPCNILGCNKELLKQTILKQEAVFRDQILELHRIYNMQRELMDGIRRNELCKHNLRLEASWPSSSLSTKNAQKICFSPNLPWSTGQSSDLIDGSIQLPMASAQKKSRQICPGSAPTVTEESLKDSKEGKYRKIGKKILDLQLPADEYIDSEEGECLDREKINQGHFWTERKFCSAEGSALTQGSASNCMLGPSCPSHTGFPFHIVSGTDIISSGFSPAELWKTPVSDFGQSSIAVQELPSFSYYASLDRSSKSLTKTSGFGRNELCGCVSAKSVPKLDNQNFLLENSFCSRSKLLDLPSLGTNDPNKFHNSGSSDNRELAKYVKGSEDVRTSKNLNLNITPGDYSDTPVSQRIQITGVDNGLQDSISGLSWLKEKPVCKGKPRVSSDTQCFEVLPSEVFWNQSETRSIKEIERGCIFDITSPREHVPRLGNQMSADERNKSESLAGLIDLNSCMVEDKHKPMGVDFKAPVSPENKECSPPRGESDENQLEVLLQSAEQEDPKVREEPVRIAAEALVSISRFVANDSHQMTTFSSSESFLSNPLNWFAGIVSATVNHPENEIEEVFSSKANNLKDFLLAGMDYFEFMTETKVDDCFCKSDDEIEEVSGSTLPAPLKKCRTNKGRWLKDFENEILPSLASLSRYEVTEDLQTIGGTHSEIGSLRSSGKNALARRSKLSFASTSNNTVLKKLTNRAELGIEKRGLTSWGKACRKRRGQRVPITNPKFILRSI
ncbi:hypothetical protein Lal_00006671 [Lupinus albus]|uniref:Uncharacterized protein n=1 Tax=Lupinus albus TaxID=3870 RepID=A0A6A4Q7N9_LUPAL|nr:hypothetical protein Lalb_Chr07g0178221 [Lupinus albus]KAF1876040.1 hypothetical protein Lal_00006671 [Lupinus albus]